MRICFVSPAILGYRYGRQISIIGRELVKRGIEVYALAPQIKGQRKIEQIDGIIVLSFPYPSLKVFFSGDFFRLPRADIYEIWDPFMLSTYLTVRATLKSKHIVEFTTPMGREDIRKRIAIDPKLKYHRKVSNLKIPYLPYYLYSMYLRPYLVEGIVSKGDAYFCEGKYMINEVKKIHNLKSEPIFMPHAIELPAGKPVKSSQPTVCFLGTWTIAKGVERFIELARHFPKIQFIAMGRERDPERDKELREIGSKIPNLEMPGVVSEEQKKEILEKSWILANTSLLEALPQAFIEACSYRCAILSAENPDDFAQSFGYHVQNDDFESGLEYLLEDNRWREKGERGFEYVKETCELNKVIDRRIEVYQSLLEKRGE